MVSPKYLEWGGCFFGLLGSLLLAMNNGISGFGFISFFVSNVFWVFFALSIKSHGLLLMQAGFFITSSLGIYRWLF